MFFEWRPDRNSDIPLYIQFSEYIYKMINNGHFTSNDRLPSQRTMSVRFGLGRNTVIQALEKLTREGVVAVRPGSGIFVNKQPGSTPDWEEYIRRANYRPAVDEYRMWRDKEGIRDFALSGDFNMAKYFKEAIAKASERTSEMQLTSAHGLHSLRESVVEYMKGCCVETSVDNVIIFPSIDLTIYTLCAALMSNGSSLLHETATLLNAISNIHSLGLNMIPIKQDQYGMDPSYLKQILITRKHPVMFTDPIGHSPTGVTTTKTRQQKIINLTNKYRIPVIEQGHKRDAWCGKPYPPPMKALPGSDNIIYLGTFLKGPVRMGITWVIADRPLVEHLSNVLVQFSAAPGMLAQIITDEMFRTGKYYEMMADIREFICLRRSEALQMCGHYLKDIATWSEKNCAFHFWIKMNHKINKERIYDAPNFFPGYFFDKKDTQHVLLCPAALPANALEDTVKSIAALAQ